MRQLRWFCRVLRSVPSVYWQPCGIRPLYTGGSDWLGVRLWPLWVEWCPNRTKK